MKSSKYIAVFPTDKSVQWYKSDSGERWKLVNRNNATIFDSKKKAWQKVHQIFNNYYNKDDLIRKGFVIKKI